MPIGKTLTFSFLIGAAVASGFKTSIGRASKTVKTLGNSITSLEQERGRFERLLTLRKRIKGVGDELAQAREELRRKKAAMDAVGGGSAKLRREYAQLERRVKTLTDKRRASLVSLREFQGEMRREGTTVKDLAARYRTLGSALDKAKAKRAALAHYEAKHSAALERRANLRGQLFDTMAMGAMVAAPVVHAIRMDDARARLGTVLNAKDKDAAMGEATRMARKLAMDGLVTLGEGYDIQYALNSAGLSASAARTASQVVAKVAKVTSGVPERVGEVVATTYNNLGSTLEGSTAERLGRIGDLLTKAQLKFQIRDFGQLGDSMSEGAAGMANYKVQLEQGITMLGQLNTAGLQGGRAGTALNAVLRSLGKAQEEWGIELIRNESGQLDMIATLEQLQGALSGLDQDAKAQALQKVFGDEGAKGVVPLLDKLDELKAAYSDVSEGSKGIVDKEVERFTKNAAGQWRKLSGVMSVLGDVIGSTVVPGVVILGSALAAILAPVANFATEHKTLATILGGSVAGILAVTVGSVALGYAFTFVSGGVARLGMMYAWLTGRTLGATVVTKAHAVAQFLAARATVAHSVAQKAWAMGSVIAAKGLGIVTTAIRIMGVAAMANPVGLIIGGLALLGAVLIAKWAPVREFFVKLWDGVVSAFKTAWKTIKSLPLIGSAIELFSGSGASKPVASPLGRAIGAAPETAVASPPAASVPGARSGSGAVAVTIHQTINVGAGADATAVRQAVDQGTEGLGTRIRAEVRRIFEEERRLAYD